MNQLLKQSTTATVVVGPVLDSSGAAVTTAVVADFSIAKNGTVAALSSETVTHSTNGFYTIALSTTNTNTLGRLDVIVNNSAMSMSTHRFSVLASAAFDTLVTNGTLASSTSGRTITVDASGNLTVGGYATGQAPLQPTVAGRTLDVSLGGEAGIDWANIGSPTTTVAFTGTTISTSQGVASVSGAVGSVTGAVGSVTGNVGGNVTGSVGSLATQAKADVNAEFLDVLTTDTFAELSTPPAATSSLKDKLVYVFQWLRNKSTQTSTQRKLYADDGSTVVATETVSDDGTTYTKGEAS